MNCLNTTGSRDASPVTNMVLSHDSSPSAFFNQSPSPDMCRDYAAATGLGPTLDMRGFPEGLSNAAAAAAVPHQLDHLPPPPYASAHVGPYMAGFPMFQRPHFEMPRCQLSIDRIPLKSRVETQIPIKMRLSPLPPGIKRLHLPTHTISKPKLLAKPRPERSPDMLELYTTLVCTSAMQSEANKIRAVNRAAASTNPPRELTLDEADEEENKPANGGDIWICKGCVQRERKRADRKKSKKVDEEESWRRDENRRAIVFNTNEIKEWQTQPSTAAAAAGASEYVVDGLVEAAMRIACYCRHHGEKAGFQVIFTIKDHRDQVVAQAFSDSIMITDDHKTHAVPVAGATITGAEAALAPATVISASTPATTLLDTKALSPPTTFRASHSTSDLPALKRQSMPFPGLSRVESSKAICSVATPITAAAAAAAAVAAAATSRTLSRPASPTGQQGPFKKRKSNNAAKVPTGLAMTRLETSELPPTQAPGTASQATTAISTATSPFSLELANFPAAPPDNMFAPTAVSPTSNIQPFSNGPPTPNSNTDQAMFSKNNRSISSENLAMTQMYSAPTSAHPSRAPSPTGLRSSVSALQQAQFAQQSIANNMFPLSMGMNMAAGAQASIINKIIPAEGPRNGGIEVTILGQGFYQGLDVMFGDQKATTTTFWGESSLVCLVPPSPTAGFVPVTLKQMNRPAGPSFGTGPSHVTFRYVEDDEQQLLRTALTVLSRKMTGKFEDAQDVARRILGAESSSWGASGSAAGGSASGSFTGFSARDNFESQLLKVLELIDLDDSMNKARLNLRRRSTGQTMLHLACALGLHRFVAGLLARSVNTDVRDNGGYTALHLAALNNQPEIVRRLICAGADPTIRTLSGLTAAEVAEGSREVLHAMRRLERHARSRSGASLHSRASSAASLKSLWEPPTATKSAQLAAAEYNSDPSDSNDEETLEYSREATTEEDDGGDDEAADASEDEFLDMRRGSVHARRAAAEASPAPLVPGPVADSGVPVPPAMASPATAAMTAFREQLTAPFQQFMAQLPTSITMPPNPLPDYYQAYLNSAAFQRISSLVPNIGGSRPGSSSSQQRPGSKEMEGRWWDLSSLMPSYGMPPAYEEIFPNKDLDTKQATAAAAAAEAEADSKCAALYDQASCQEHDQTTPQESPARELPALLQIGRKNAITKEQQENLRRAHAARRKGLRSDTSLYTVWVCFASLSFS